jgi:transcriptional regulator with XRE-family HTH domain
MGEQSYLSEAIRAARRRAGLSQAELAELLGVRQSSVSQWERGSTRPSTVHLLALTAALKCSLLDFSGAGGDGAGAGTGEGAGGAGAGGDGAGAGAGRDGAAGGDGAEAFEHAGRAAESVS